jgi:hypothetical protein
VSEAHVKVQIFECTHFMNFDAIQTPKHFVWQVAAASPNPKPWPLLLIWLNGNAVVHLSVFNNSAANSLHWRES